MCSDFLIVFTNVIQVNLQKEICIDVVYYVASLSFRALSLAIIHCAK